MLFNESYQNETEDKEIPATKESDKKTESDKKENDSYWDDENQYLVNLA